jgi:hypothetical protein
MTADFWTTYTRNRRLTGAIRHIYRVEGFFKRRLICLLQVEESWEEHRTPIPRINRSLDNEDWVERVSWRCADPNDLADPALRWIIDGTRDQA